MSEEKTTTNPEETSVEAKTISEPNTQESTNDDFVSREDFNKLFKENMKRKSRLEQLESELEELRQATGQVEQVSEDVKKYKKLLEEKDRTITEMTHKSKVRDRLSKLDPINDRIIDLVFNDAANADVLGDETDLDNFLKMWKKDNPTLFKAESTIATSPNQKEKVETQSVDVSDLENLGSMSRGERQRLPKNKYDDMMEALKNQAYGK